MTKEHFEEANQLYDYMADIEDNLKKLDRINNQFTEDATVFEEVFEDAAVFVLGGKVDNGAWKEILKLCAEKTRCYGAIIPKGLESEVIKKIHECLSEELKDCQMEFASL